ncbi:MAG: polyketide synthase dehydratase domain-containing protein [Syntrophales bacterium]|nr:polyketide synthase dehydratase domain-containing protein [Syntrophales bacterium]
MTGPGLSKAESPVRGNKFRLPLPIPILPYLRDHNFTGKTILPAVEILQYLAGAVRSCQPDAPVHTMHAAAFDRFLDIPETADLIEALVELESHADGRLSARLMTVGRAGRTGVTRTKVHAVVDFMETGKRSNPLPVDLAAALEGVCFEVPAEGLYQDLVPFGPAFQSLQGKIFLSENGAAGSVRALNHPASSGLLGSPFPLDGAFHAACAWGQRYCRVVGFPVGFDARFIQRPTMQGEGYRFMVVPVSTSGASLRFDIRIFDMNGGLCEEVRGVLMKDVTGGRVTPPAWIRHEGVAPLAAIREKCRALSIIEMEGIADFAVQALSGEERHRFEEMGERRKRTYLAARLALKHLARKLSGGDLVTPSSDIHTVMPDGIRPCCPVPGDSVPVFCSVSHDSRFAVAVAGSDEIGIDVEKVSARVLKARRLYMSGEEMALTETSAMGVVQASVRVWSIKEGVTKARDIPLDESWKTVKVHDIGLYNSCLTVNGMPYAAFHDTEEDHIFTLVKRV